MTAHSNPSLAAALLLCLAIAAPAAAQDVSEEPEEATSEDADWTNSDSGIVEEDASVDEAASDSKEDSSSTADDAGAGTSADPTEAGKEESDGKQLKRRLKGLLIGLLLPAVEKRVRKAVGDDATPTDQSGYVSAEVLEAQTEQEP